MVIRQFTRESYGDGARHPAWQEALGALGLRAAPLSQEPGLHASAALRAGNGLTLGRIAAGGQVLTPLPQGIDLPIFIVVQDEGAVLKSTGAGQVVRAGTPVLLPRQGDGALVFKGDVRAVVLSVSGSAFRGRKIGAPVLRRPELLDTKGLAAVLARTLESAVDALEDLADPEWLAIEQHLAELLLTVVRRRLQPGAETASSTQAALLHRVCQTIEKGLGDPDLSPATVADAEGISARYIQKLFETTGETFSHYVRERRLQRTYADLANPAEGDHGVSEIAYRCGFTDAAHFSRAFRQRFGLSPRAFRQQEAEHHAGLAIGAGQRGWPQDALAQLRTQLDVVQAPDGPGISGDAQAAVGEPAAAPHHHHLAVDADTVHWGFFSRALQPVLEIASGDTITVETLTQHASDDPGRMIAGDPGAESVFRWTADGKAIDRRGAGPMNASVYGRGAGEGFGVHICTGPIAVKGAEPGDVLEVRILDIVPRRNRSAPLEDRVFGSSAAAWWGYHYAELLSDPNPREVVTVYEVFPDADAPHARALYSYLWEPQTDPFGVVHKTYDYPGVAVLPGSVKRRNNVLEGIRIPLRPQFGVIGVAPRQSDLVDSVPPSYFGGNLDNWRLGKGAAVYLPVSVPGALLSIGDPHAAQGDGELGGTAIECSMTGTLAVVLHKKSSLDGRPFADLTYPLIETETEWVLTGFSHPNYLAEFGAMGPSDVYANSSLDLAMKDAFRKTRRFLMNTQGLDEDEAIALISAAVDFGVTQVVDGNWGVHAILRKGLFAGRFGPGSSHTRI